MYISLVDPTNDKTFRNIFGNEKNVEITRGFIEAVTGLNVQDVQFTNSVINSDIDAERTGIVDVVCRLPSGQQILVEMQKSYQRYFKERISFYTSRIYRSQLLEGDEFNKLCNVIVIAIMNFPLPMKNDD